MEYLSGYMFEVVSMFVGVLFSILGFFIKKLYTRFEGVYADVRKLETNLMEHRIQDAKLFIEKSELQSFREELKNMNNALQTKLQSIEEHLRQHYDRRSI